MNTTLHILTTQAQRITALLLLVASLGWTNAQAQSATFSLQVVGFNKVDVRPALCSPRIGVEPFENTIVWITGSENEAVIQWVSGSEGKKITIEGKKKHSLSSLHAIVRPITKNIYILSPSVLVGKSEIRDLLIGGSSINGRAEARIMFYDTGSTLAGAERQTIVYTILDS